MFKRILMIALLGASLMCAKTYDVTLSEPAQAGNTLLKPGEYHLKVDGPQVVLTDNVGRRIEVTAVVESVQEKFEQTRLSIWKENGTNRVQWIQLGGSKTRVVFQSSPQSE